MAITTLEGVLEIELSDVYGWLCDKHGVTESATGLRFSVEEDALVVDMAAEKDPIYIDAVDFWNWVNKNHLPAGIFHYETVFGVPTEKKDNDVLSITFASSNTSNPRSWARQPACLMEWRQPTAHQGTDAKESEADELIRLRDALQRIANIENDMYGGDWDEIEEARQIAEDALGGKVSTVPPGRWIHVSNGLPKDSDTFEGRVAAIDESGYLVAALVLPNGLVATSGIPVEYWLAVPPLEREKEIRVI